VPRDQFLVVLGPSPGAVQTHGGTGSQYVNLAAHAAPEKLRAFLATLSSMVVIDRFVATASDPTSADIAVVMLGTGVPILFSIDAVTSSATFDRLLRLLANPILKVYQEPIGNVMQCEHNFHVHMHLNQPGGSRLGYVSEVQVLTDVAERPWPALMPLITADRSPTCRTWTHAVWLQDGALRYQSPDHSVPAELQAHLADIPDDIWEQWRSDPLARPVAGVVDPTLRAYRQLLREARMVFEAGDFAAAAERLEAAAAMSANRSLEDLADELLAGSVCEPLNRHVTETATAIAAALDAGEWEAAVALLDTPANVLVWRACTRSPDWHTLDLRIGAMRVARETCEHGLKAVKAAEDRGDLREAYAIATSIRTAFLIPEVQRTLLSVRHALLQKLITQLEQAADVQDTYVAELAQITDELIAMQHQRSGAASAPSEQHTSTVPTHLESSNVSGQPDPPREVGTATGVRGWLDAALARNRERWHRQPSELDARGER
jgi:hypothetical protein